jgi:hypothetical protein
MHGEVINNLGQAKIRQKRAYASQKGKHMLFKFQEGKTYVKMKKMSMASSCDRHFYLLNTWIAMDFWSRMKEEGFALSKEKMTNCGIDLEEIYNSSTLNLFCED